MNKVPRVAAAVAIGVAIGLITSLVFTMLVIAVSLLVALITRVLSQERSRPVGETPKLALGLGIGALAGQLISWFGLIGGVAALVLLAILFLAAGGDLI